jgi:hypothetical protein
VQEAEIDYGVVIFGKRSSAKTARQLFVLRTRKRLMNFPCCGSGPGDRRFKSFRPDHF